MNKPWISIGVVSLALVVAGCGKSGSSEYKPVAPKGPEPANVKPGEEATLFPLTVGNSWSYDSTTETLSPNGVINTPASIRLEVKDVKPIDGNGTRATIEVFKGDVLQDRQIWVSKSDGLFQEQIGLDKPQRPEPAQLTLPFPVEVNKTVNWKGKTLSALGATVEVNQEVVNKGAEDVDTIVGMLSAYRVETTQKFRVQNNDVVVTNISWWAPKIGLVRYRQNVKADGRNVQSQTLMLKQYTVK